MNKPFDIWELNFKKLRNPNQDFITTKNVILNIFQELGQKIIYNIEEKGNPNYNPLRLPTPGEYLSLLKINSESNKNYQIGRLSETNREFDFEELAPDADTHNVELGIIFRFGRIDENNINIFNEGYPINPFDVEEDEDEEKPLPVYNTSCAIIISSQKQKIYLIRERRTEYSVNPTLIRNYLGMRSSSFSIQLSNKFTLSFRPIKHPLNSSLEGVGTLKLMDITFKPSYLKKAYRENRVNNDLIRDMVANLGNSQSKSSTISHRFEIEGNAAGQNYDFMEDHYNLFFEEINEDIKKSLLYFKIGYLEEETNEYKIKILNRSDMVIALEGNRLQENFEFEKRKLLKAWKYFYDLRIEDL